MRDRPLYRDRETVSLPAVVAASPIISLVQKQSHGPKLMPQLAGCHRQSDQAMATDALYLQELRYQADEDPGLWIAKMERAQQAFGYDDAHMLLLVELCVKHNKPATDLVRHFCSSSRRTTSTNSTASCSSTSRVQEVYAGFRRLHELCKRVDTARALKWAMLHVGCQGKHNPRNVVFSDKKLSSSLSSSSSSSSDSSEEEICMTGETEVLRFPENSFPISCGYGDFCVNDVIKFDQTLVYKNMKVGKAYMRTIVGRVAHVSKGVEIPPATRNNSSRMSENFSQSDEEPTYTIEVYWSRGVKPMDTSKPFIIKAHNLELLMPIRQRWGNEQNRVHEMEKKQRKQQGSKSRARCRNPKPSRSAENGTNLVY